MKLVFVLVFGITCSSTDYSQFPGWEESQLERDNGQLLEELDRLTIKYRRLQIKSKAMNKRIHDLTREGNGSDVKT